MSIVVAAFGDDFILPSIWEKALRQNLEPVVGEIKVISGVEDWPAIPLQFDQEVKEFVGDAAQVAELCEQAEAIVTHVAPVTQAVIDRASQLKIIGCCRGGPVNINVKAATQRGIPVVYAPGRNAQAVVEFTLGVLLTECKSIARAHLGMIHDVWRGDFYRYDKAPKELQGSVFGMIGLGAIAQMLVPYLRPFQMRVLAYDPYTPAEKFAELGVERVSLDLLLQESDVVSLHARVTPETIKMMGKPQFESMKPGAYFINTARGPLVDYPALYDALASGRLAGAALDTFDVEPPPAGWPLARLDNVTLTPHVGGSSKETAFRSADIIAGELKRFFSGQPLQFCANPQVLKTQVEN
jgi:D-3-phosphoglycerate dehydrogenase